MFRHHCDMLITFAESSKKKKSEEPEKAAEATIQTEVGPSPAEDIAQIEETKPPGEPEADQNQQVKKNRQLEKKQKKREKKMK